MSLTVPKTQNRNIEMEKQEKRKGGKTREVKKIFKKMIQIKMNMFLLNLKLVKHIQLWSAKESFLATS